MGKILTATGIAHIVCKATASLGMSVCLFVYPSMGSEQQTHSRFAAVGPAGRRYQSTAAAVACSG